MRAGKPPDAAPTYRQAQEIRAVRAQASEEKETLIAAPQAGWRVGQREGEPASLPVIHGGQTLPLVQSMAKQ